MKSWSLAPGARGRFADQGCLGPFLEDDERVAEIDTTLMGQPNQAEERGFDLEPPGDIKQCPAGPERRVQGGEDIVGGLHGLGQKIPANQVGMIPNGLVQVKEERPAQATGIGQANSRPVDVLDPGRVVRAQALPESVKCRTGRTGGLIGARGCEVLQLEGPDIGSPPLLVAGGRPGEGLEPREGLPTSVGQPGRFVAAPKERLKRRFRESAGRSCRRGCADHHVSLYMLQTKPKLNRVLDLFELVHSEVAQLSLKLCLRRRGRILCVKDAVSGQKRHWDRDFKSCAPGTRRMGNDCCQGAIGVKRRDAEHEAGTCLGSVS